MTAAGAKTARRAPLMAIGLLAMACGAWLGLIRIGWNLPLPWPDQLGAHGPLMVSGFLGTLIGLERAVALGRPWAYGAPVATAAGALLLDFGWSPGPGALAMTAGSAVVVAIFAIVCWRQPALFTVTMALGAVAWLAGNLQWLAGASIFRVVYFWVAFLVLTIAGERLELNRVLRPTRGVRAAFAFATVLLLVGTATTNPFPGAGVRLVGVALLVLTVWLVRYDVATRTVRRHGVTRFIALTLLGGYAWLGVGGLLALAFAPATPGVVYDATLHAIFLGFVVSMVFAHAPVIVPAVVNVRLEYRPTFYVHVAVLHVSLLLRVIGDLVDVLGRWRVWGGLFNALALLLFAVNTFWSVAAGSAAVRGPVSRVAG